MKFNCRDPSFSGTTLTNNRTQNSDLFSARIPNRPPSSSTGIQLPGEILATVFHPHHIFRRDRNVSSPSLSILSYSLSRIRPQKSPNVNGKLRIFLLEEAEILEHWVKKQKK